EEQKYLKAAHSGRTSDSHKRTWDQAHVQCYHCGKIGHKSRGCRSKPLGAQVAAPAAQTTPTTPAAQASHAAHATPAARAGGLIVCYTCGQRGHISRICPTNGPAGKRPTIAPRVFAVGDPSGAEPIAG